MEERASMPVPYPSYSSRHQITINPLNFGYLVNIGCNTFAIENVESLVSKLNSYLRNPEEVEGNWLENKILPE